MFFLTILTIIVSIFLIIGYIDENSLLVGIGLTGVFISLIAILICAVNLSNSFSLIETNKQYHEIIKEIGCREFTRYEERHLGVEIIYHNGSLTFYQRLNKNIFLDSIVFDDVNFLQRIKRDEIKCMKP